MTLKEFKNIFAELEDDDIIDFSICFCDRTLNETTQDWFKIKPCLSLAESGTSYNLGFYFDSNIEKDIYKIFLKGVN